MLSSKFTLICNLIAVLCFIGLIVVEMIEIQTYTGSMLGFFQ